MTRALLPFPPAGLSGHATYGGSEKVRLTKRHRGWAKVAALEAKMKAPPKGDIAVMVWFYPKNRRSDRLNFSNRMKPYFDGIADHLGVNDARFVPMFFYMPCDKANPRVEVEIGPLDQAFLEATGVPRIEF